MYIQVTKNDCIKIVNENLQGGGSKNTPLEIAMAKSILKLHERLGQINDERNKFFECIYGIQIRCDKAAGDRLANKRKTDLMRESKAHYQAMLDTARKAENISVKDNDNGDGEDKDGRGTGAA